MFVLLVGWVDVIVLERPDGGTHAGVDDHFEEGERRADGVRAQGKGRRSRQETVHDVVWVGGETDKEEKLWTFFDGTHDALDCYCRGEPTGDWVTEKGAGD